MESEDLPFISQPADFELIEEPKAAPRAAKPEPARAPRDDDDPETLLRQYAERQKTKTARFEQDLQKMGAERSKLVNELALVKTQLQTAQKLDLVVQDLQAQLDAALKSHSMLSSENAKLKMRLGENEGNGKKFEEKARQAEQNLAEAKAALERETVARQEVDIRVASAVRTLQGEDSRISSAIQSLQAKLPHAQGAIKK